MAEYLAQETHLVVQGANKFGVDLFRLLSQSDDKVGQNILISPVNISMALCMAYSGARGKTAQEMGSVLGVAQQTREETNKQNLELLRSWNSLTQKDKDVKLSLANSLWARIPLLPQFVTEAETYYHGTASSEMSAPKINAWVEDKTEKMIKDVVTPQAVAAATAILVNAVYFKGRWTHPFEEPVTREQPFQLLDGRSKSVSMMRRVQEFNYFGSQDLQIVELPYGHGTIAAYALLPAKEKPVSKLIDGLSTSQLEKIISLLRPCYVLVGLPRAHVAFGAPLKMDLQSLGLKIAFENEADFSGMALSKETISEVLHQATMDIDEEGTTAAAVTVIVPAPGSASGLSPEPIKMIMDRPFVFMLRDKQTGAILFLSAILNPEQLAKG
jgi:serine protease inhibitor